MSLVTASGSRLTSLGIFYWSYQEPVVAASSPASMPISRRAWGDALLAVAKGV